MYNDHVPSYCHTMRVYIVLCVLHLQYYIIEYYVLKY